MTTDSLTYAGVQDAFDRVYAQLREDNQENAPNSYTWFAATLDELAAEVGSVGEDEIAAVKAGGPHEVIGEPDSPTVAWAFECNGNQVYRITEWTTDGALIEFFGRCMGYDL